MNLELANSIYAGGPGSGCQGQNCGRKPGTKSGRQPSYKDVAVDFDGTISDHEAATPGLGPPLPNGLAFLKELSKAGYTVHVLTARPDIPEVQQWLEQHGVGFAKATNTKPPAAAYVDDRAVNWTGHQTVEEGMAQVNRLSEVRKKQEMGKR